MDLTYLLRISLSAGNLDALLFLGTYWTTRALLQTKSKSYSSSFISIIKSFSVHLISSLYFFFYRSSTEEDVDFGSISDDDANSSDQENQSSCHSSDDSDSEIDPEDDRLSTHSKESNASNRSRRSQQ